MTEIDRIFIHVISGANTISWSMELI